MVKMEVHGVYEAKRKAWNSRMEANVFEMENDGCLDGVADGDKS